MSASHSKVLKELKHDIEIEVERAVFKLWIIIVKINNLNNRLTYLKFDAIFDFLW